MHLPAVNTPQFNWCRTTLDRHPQPVLPIYEPEIAAKYIVEVALDGRRSRIVGSWNKVLVAAGQVAPGFGNQYAARGAWEAQLSSETIDPDRPDNLREPHDDDEDAGAGGIFGAKAHGFFDPSFLRSLPKTARTFVDAAVGAVKDHPRSAPARGSEPHVRWGESFTDHVRYGRFRGENEVRPGGRMFGAAPSQSGPGLRYGLRVYGALVPYGSLVIKYLSRAG